MTRNFVKKSKFYLKFFAAQKQHEMRSCSMTNLFAIFERHASFYVNWNWKKCPYFKIQPSFVSTNLHHIFSIFYFERVPPTKTKHVYLSFVSCGHPSQIKPARVHKLRCNLQRWYHQSLWKVLCKIVSNCKAKSIKMKKFLGCVTCHIARLLSYYKQQSNLL